MHPRKLVRDSLGFAATQYFVRALLTLRGVIAARLLGPAAYGAWNAIQLMMDYGSFAPLGTQQGLDQTVPARIVEGDTERLKRLERAGLFNNLALTLFFLTACVLFLARGRSSRVLGFWGAGGVAMALACVLLGNVSIYHLSLLRSNGRFSSVNTWFAIQALVGAGLGLSLIPAFGAWGLLLGWLAGTAAALLVARWQGRDVVPLLPMPSREGLRLLQVGFPMFVSMGSALVMRSLDRVIILRFLGTLELGYYSIAVMALGFLLYLPDSVSYVLYPELVRTYHAGGDGRAAVAARFGRVRVALSLMVPALCGIAYLCGRDLVVALLPSFRPGLTALRVTCFGAGGLALSGLCSILLMTLGRQAVLIPVAIGSTLLGAALDYGALRLGYGISGVAWATLVTYVVNGAVLLALSRRALGDRFWEIVQRVWSAFLPLAISLALAYGLDRFFPWAGPRSMTLRITRLAIALVLFMALYAAAVYPLGRRIGFRQMLLEFRFPFLGALRRNGPRGAAADAGGGR